MCAHSGLLFVLLMGVGIFAIAGWLPPHDPSWTAAEIVRIFTTDRTRIRIGISILALGSVLWWSFSAVIATQMKRIEGRTIPWRTSSSRARVAPCWPCSFQRTSGSRSRFGPRRQSRVPFSFSTIWPGFPSSACTRPRCCRTSCWAAAYFPTRASQPVFPRWVGFVNFWLAICYAVGALIPFFKRGPFAWNGLFGFWLAAVSFFGWIFVMWWATVRAIRLQTADDSAA